MKEYDKLQHFIDSAFYRRDLCTYDEYQFYDLKTEKYMLVREYEMNRVSVDDKRDEQIYKIKLNIALDEAQKAFNCDDGERHSDEFLYDYEVRETLDVILELVVKKEMDEQKEKELLKGKCEDEEMRRRLRRI